MRYNPFRPNGIISPGIFQGRLDEIHQIGKGLFQAKHDNPVHFLIQGERGIGKSSLLFLVKLIAEGRIASTFPGMNFLVVSVDLGGASTQLDIVRALGRELKSAVGEKDRLADKAKAFWEWATNWEILGVRYHKDAAHFDPQDAADALIGQIATLCSQLKGDVDGILVMIDEADRPSEDAGLGELCKTFTERLARRGCLNVVFGMAGLPTIMSKLRASHESSPRLFTTMLLEPLLPEEREAVVRAGIDEANEKNETKTDITPAAIRLLSDMSEGYPHFIQQFAYSAFEADTDNSVDIDDVFHGAFRENGAISQLGDKYFSNMYHSRIASDDYRGVLHIMAEHGDDWITRREIIELSGLPKTTVTNALNALKAREIIVADESRKNRGFYRLPTRSFAAWINAQKSAQRTSTLGGLFADAPLGGD